MIVIGEKLNATLKRAREIVSKREESSLLELAAKQAAAGADYLDVNVATGIGSHSDEIEAMTWAVETIQREMDIPLCIDSADAVVLEAGLEARGQRPSLVNSVKAEEASIAEVLPLVSRYGASVVALAMDESGIPKTVEGRIEACEKTASACAARDIPFDRVFFDPLVLPVSTDNQQGLVTLLTLRAIKERFPEAKTSIGLSNISYGLPARAKLNTAFLHMAVFAGLDAAILDPLKEEVMTAVRVGEVLTGRDRHCRRYIRAFRTGGSQ